MENLEKTSSLERPKFDAKIKKEVLNFKTGEVYQMTGGDEIVFSDKDVETITRICSQEEIYTILFKRRLDGKPYTEENAQVFINWVKKGWEDKTYFVFIIRDGDNNVIGTIDIKSSDLESAEVGYWADRNTSGFMTNALQVLEAIAAEAGYKKLYAKVVAHNEKSMGVLERAGFVKRKESRLIEDREYNEFDVELTNDSLKKF